MASGPRDARVRFLTTREGGRETTPVSGVRSQIELGAFQTSFIVEGADGQTELPLGQSVNVQITVLFEERAGAAFMEVRNVRLYEGAKLVATGTFLDMQNRRAAGPSATR
ncbi:hypothetical protein [Cellulosimicrobium sp. CpK407]|uniref:hypothetical protein n=1 Tax=Cellulosimicrobium sp. CpK407 TaxID=3229847 RepID=UPI003F33265D